MHVNPVTNWQYLLKYFTLPDLHWSWCRGLNDTLLQNRPKRIHPRNSLLKLISDNNQNRMKLKKHWKAHLLQIHLHSLNMKHTCTWKALCLAIWLIGNMYQICFRIYSGLQHSSTLAMYLFSSDMIGFPMTLQITLLRCNHIYCCSVKVHRRNSVILTEINTCVSFA